MNYGAMIEPTERMRKVLQMCVDWYGLSGNECGGSLHVILDDDNIDEYWINKFREDAADPEAIAILDGLKQIPEEQRIWVTYNIHNTLGGKPAREIYEEIEE